MAGNEPDWQGLLKWSLAHADGTGVPRQISEEEKKWFHEAMQNQTIDVIRRMKEITTVMNMPQQVLDDQGVTAEELEKMLEELQEHVESIDMANDLHAIGGLIPLLNYLKHSDAGIRARAAEVVTTVVQNNERSQKQVMDVKGMEMLLENFTSDSDMNVRAKALGAISSLISNNKAGVTSFRLSNCYAGLRDALASGHVRLQRKALQVIMNLLLQYPSDGKVIGGLGLPRVITTLINTEDGGIRQAALQTLVEISKTGGQAEVTDCNNQLKQILAKRIEEIKKYDAEDLAAAKEERRSVDELWQLCFNEPSPLRESGLLVSEADESDAAEVSNAPPGVSESQEEKKAPMLLLGP
ncbi:hsp70-interacting protein [Marchantia polymorpha subsp. ruderalis]|uniref:TOG domain-containing protein n=2 Tax=Marchantia polymorpha TaxID=3197 RepID=A0A176VEH6_MARPO|nr:hypothetical protein AXG93_1860s1130 [Marchantia polymorpha subsp. ruderalis]PTQ35621.1 hypothetical protein MARPO_0070s0083 [Marchantia polymorpha]BBN08732.1 hypothetical protein Mp_4g13980 [Marchantia polymorpha subsp. ruderalis]|eukprot:PTQ35621.1 hypothetical protein MARPO_0070s0083 [Marchantia polymorpha]